MKYRIAINKPKGYTLHDCKNFNMFILLKIISNIKHAPWLLDGKIAWLPMYKNKKIWWNLE